MPGKKGKRGKSSKKQDLYNEYRSYMKNMPFNKPEEYDNVTMSILRDSLIPQAREMYANKLLDVQPSATKIQKIARGYNTRKKIEREREQANDAIRKAATDIQRIYRGHKYGDKEVMNIAKEQLKRKNDSATEIQRMYRGMLGRYKATDEKYKKHRDEVDLYHEYLRDRDRREREIVKREKAATEIQRIFRGYKGKIEGLTDLGRRVQAAEDIGRIYRGYKARKEAKRLKYHNVMVDDQTKLQQDYLDDLQRKQKRIDKLKDELFAQRMVNTKIDSLTGKEIEEDPWVPTLAEARANTAIGAFPMGSARRLKSGEWTPEETMKYSYKNRSKNPNMITGVQGRSGVQVGF